MKYVTFKGFGGKEIIVFPDSMQHKRFAEAARELSFGALRPISGGFVVDGECVGESISLRMKSRGNLDTALLTQLEGRS